MVDLTVFEVTIFSGLLLAFLLTVIRLVRGPSLNDRVIALDLIATITSAFIVIYIFITELTIYLDIVLIISMISFLGAVGISQYLKKRYYDS